jgi:sulfite reductase (NADPH) flavoprotein alpha-component
MSAQITLPKSAPFDDDAISGLNRILTHSSETQRAWLAGYLAGLDAANANPVAAPVARAAEPLLILYATESGNSEGLALDTAKLARKQGFKPATLDFADLDVATLASHKRIIVIAATWGEGEPPARATRAYTELLSDAAPRLTDTTFAVLAMGDTAYADFCTVGKTLDARLESLGGKRAVERIDCDLDFAAPAKAWIAKTLEELAPEDATANVVAVDFSARAAGEVSREPVTAEVIGHVNLNSSRSGKQTFHVALGFDAGAPAYEPGDALDLYPQNDPALVEEILIATKLSDGDLARELTTERDITTLSVNLIEKFAAATGHAGAKALLDEGAAREWVAGRQLIDLLEAFPVSLDAQQLRSLTRTLPPRAYSIASARSEVGDEAHLLVAAVRYETFGRARTGVASGHVADRIRNGAEIKVRLKPNKHFRLPSPDTDIIMIGPGTGIAPFRAFVQERRTTGAAGRNWLFFGDRTFTHDFLYQLEWQDALKDGSLHRLDLAFSRDRPQKVYVQDRIREREGDLVAWIENGAKFYVCGDANAMAKDVRAALVGAFAAVKALSPEAADAHVALLERSGQYLQDVY